MDATPLMKRLLAEIADLLRSRGLEVEFHANAVMAVADIEAETAVTFIITEDCNGYPFLWMRAFPFYTAKYVMPIAGAVGDAHDEIVECHVNEQRSRYEATRSIEA